MAERRKRGPLTPEEERQELRSLTRELHEAAQNARAAARELRDARATTEKAVAAYVDEALTGFGNYLTEQARIVNEQIERVSMSANDALALIEQTAKNTEARLAGYSSAHEVGLMMTAGIRGAIETLSREQVFIEDVAIAVASAVGGALELRSPKARGQVLVATEEAMADFIARGGDPGIVLDARS